MLADSVWDVCGQVNLPCELKLDRQEGAFA